MSIIEIGAIVALGVTTIGAIFAIYDRFSKPDIKADNEIGLIKQGCEFKHNGIDKEIVAINNAITLIKENHLRHIETDISELKNGQTKILTILEAKYQIKVE